MDKFVFSSKGLRVCFDAIVLAGGGGSRLGGVDKAHLRLGATSLWELAHRATRLARRRVVVRAESLQPAPQDRVPPWLMTHEDPPGGGPVAGVVAGLQALAAAESVPSPWVLVMAIDHVGGAEVVPTLLAAARTLEPDHDGLCPLDSTGHPQWLLALYRTKALTSALGPYGSGHGHSVRRLASSLKLRDVPVADGLLRDLDTPADLAHWQQRWANS